MAQTVYDRFADSVQAVMAEKENNDTMRRSKIDEALQRSGHGDLWKQFQNLMTGKGKQKEG